MNKLLAPPPPPPEKFLRGRLWLEFTPIPAKTEEELEQNHTVIKVCGYNTGSVK